MRGPRLLDAFSGAGGAALGYHRAGFDVVGVDIRPMPRYPFEHHVGDALDYIREHGHEFDVIHASPPCQAFTQMSAKYRGYGKKADSHHDLLTPTRKLLSRLAQPWVIENVIGAKDYMSTGLILHGGMFGLRVYRPRRFESNVLLLGFYAASPHDFVGVYGDHPQRGVVWRNNGNYRTAKVPKKSVIVRASSINEARLAMGIDWMEWDEIKEAIPPSYTEYLGRQLMAYIHAGPRPAVTPAAPVEVRT